MEKKLLNAIFISTAIVLVYSFLLVPLGIFDIPILMSMDLINRCVCKFSHPPDQADDIAVISVDRESLRKLSQRWPWTRDVFAEMLLNLKECQPRLIYLDFAFIGDTEYDDVLSRAMDEAGNVIIPFYFDEKGEPLFPVQRFMELSAGFGPVNKLRDRDLTVRDALLVYFSKIGKVIDYSIEIIIICKYFGVALSEVSLEGNDLIIDLKKDKKLVIPIKSNGALPINYSVTLKDIEVVPFWRIIKNDFPREVFKNKIVIVGITDKALIDSYQTPLGMLSGVEVIVNTILTVISRDFVKYVSRGNDLPIVLFMILLVTITVIKLPLWKSFSALVLGLCSYLGINIFLSACGYRFEVFSVLFLCVLDYVVSKIYKFICLLEEQNYDLQKALRDLREAESELVRAERLAAIGRLSAQLSHEINNPLCAIQNNINAIKYIINHGGKIEKIADINEQVSRELERLTKLSREVLSFSRQTKGEVQEVNLNELLNETVNFYQGQLEEKKIKVSLNLVKKAPYVKASLNALKQIFSNLIINAQDAMPDGGALTISTNVIDERYIECDIADTGCGISDEIMNNIFEPFFTTKEEEKGTGLGLYTVYNIVKGYGGTIDVKSKVGAGTTFIVKFPIK